MISALIAIIHHQDNNYPHQKEGHGVFIKKYVRKKEPGDPQRISLWLLPSGPDQVGDGYVRPTPDARYGLFIAKLQEPA